MKLQTTLAILRAAQPCADGWSTFLRHVGADFPDDKPIDFSTILASNGLEDALWALRAVLPEQEADRDRAARLFACDCAEAVLPIFERARPNDNRPRDAIRVAREYAHGRATAEQLAAAWAAARDAAWAGAWDAARAAAWAAAWAAARDAARDAERAGAWAAAWAAARDAERAGAWDAAWDVQRALFIRYFCTAD